MSTAWKLAQQNLKAAQQRMKVWYDGKAHKYSFNPRDKVLSLLPIPCHQFQARYSGSYMIEEKVSDVNYIVQTLEWWKTRQLCHINKLKEYYEKYPPRSLTKQCTYFKTNGSFCQCGNIPETEE